MVRTFALLAVLMLQYPAVAADAWAYCTAEIAGDETLADGAYKNVRVCYATEHGCRIEMIRFRYNTDGHPSKSPLAGAPEATAKALAQLGMAGWELVAVTVHPNSPDAPRYHFKRRMDGSFPGATATPR